MDKIIDCFDYNGDKQCELHHTEELTPQELRILMELQKLQGRVCRGRQTEEEVSL